MIKCLIFVVAILCIMAVQVTAVKWPSCGAITNSQNILNKKSGDRKAFDGPDCSVYEEVTPTYSYKNVECDSSCCFMELQGKLLYGMLAAPYHAIRHYVDSLSDPIGTHPVPFFYYNKATDTFDLSNWDPVDYQKFGFYVRYTDFIAVFADYRATMLYETSRLFAPYMPPTWKYSDHQDPKKFKYEIVDHGTRHINAVASTCSCGYYQAIDIKSVSKCEADVWGCYKNYLGEFTCVDIDECEEKTDNCDLVPHSYCVNTPGSFRCECQPGYLSSGSSCIDVSSTIISEAKPTSTSSRIAVISAGLPRPSWKYSYNITDVSNPTFPLAVYKATQIMVSQEIAKSGIYISNLNPGTNYSVTWDVLDENNTVITDLYRYSSDSRFTTLCTCGLHTDAPVLLGEDTITQENGYVYFKFLGNSMCGNAYTFARQSYDSDGNPSKPTVFTPNYFFTGGECSPVPYEPGKASSDVLASSKLAVGKKYRYTLRAVGEKYLGDQSYMDFVVRWESSISGFVGLQPTFGDLPVEDVIVQWALKDLNGTIVLDGKTKTSKSGRFTIHPNALIPFDNDLDYPLHLSFSKVTELDNAHSINHEFLCNNGRVNCTDTEHVIYLKHLDFDVPVSVIDATSVPISGKVYVADTSVNPDDTRWGSDGCPVEKAKVCLIDRSPSGTQSEIICTETANDGTYTVPGVIGSRVSINVTFHNHTFEYLPPKGFPDFSTGIEIKPHHIYEHNDFMDTTTVPLEITIAGGECDLPLGAAIVSYIINGCNWGGGILTQSGFRNVHNTIPAHNLQFSVISIEKRPDIVLTSQNMDLRLVPSREVSQAVLDEQDMEMVNITELRFQYDGKSRLRVEFEGDMNYGCKKMTPDTGNVDSLHVLPFQRPSHATIFIERDLGAGLVCDAVDPSSKITIQNNLGLMAHDSSDDVYAAAIASSMQHEALELLYHCNQGCVANVTHDYDMIAKRNRRARVEFQFMTGRPNTAEPFTKQLIVRTAESNSVSYTAAVVITGQYKKGDLYSVGLPTYDPVLIIRDPPGGGSFSYYENVQSTLRIDSRKHTEYLGADVSMKLLAGQKADVGSCAGIGVQLCKDVVKIKELLGFHLSTSDFNLQKLNSTVYSGGLTSTWSYKTPSSNALLAGNLSDTYVVPNLNMKFSIIETVSWNETTCTASSIEETAYNLESPENVPALAFVTGFEIVNTEIPALESNIASTKLHLNKTTDDTERAKLEMDLKAFEDALQGWRDALELNAELKRQAIDGDSNYQVKPHEWFEKVASKSFESDTNAIDTSEMVHNSALLSENLMSRAKVRPAYKNARGSITNLQSINTIKFSGGGNEFAFRLSQSKMEQHVSDLGKSSKYTSAFGMDHVSDDTFTSINFVIEKVIGGKAEGSRENFRTDETSESTNIGFSLSDPDAGDQFDVDVFVDPFFGTFVFHTRSGKSVCKHEVGTENRQDVTMELISIPPPIVLENEAMVFHYRITKRGLGSQGYILVQDVQEDSDALRYFPTLPREYSILESGKSVYGTLTITRGPGKYDFPAVTLRVQPTCEFRMQALLGNDATFAEIQLYNFIDPLTNEKKIVFARPCAPVTLQGDVARDQMFVVRASNPDAAVKVVVQNPRSSSMTWAVAVQDSETRLKKVQLHYRPIGTSQWFLGQRIVNGTMEDIDFALTGVEDAYGFATLEWEVKHLADGNYEMQVRTVCDNVQNAPAIFNGQQTEIIQGVFDRKPPKLYGLPQPQVRLPIGQPITITFDKPLDCSLPHKFVVDLQVVGMERKFDNDNLLLICEDRQIMVQFDGANTDMNDLVGKSLSMNLTQVIDANRNIMASKVSYSVEIIAADTDQALYRRRLDAQTVGVRNQLALSDLEEFREILKREILEEMQVIREEGQENIEQLAREIKDSIRALLLAKRAI